MELKNRILDNYTIEYDMVVNFSIDDLLKMDTHLGSAYTNQEKAVVSALQMYLERVKKNAGLNVQYGEAIKAMEPLIAGNSCDQNNIKVINFAKPLVLLLSEHGIEKIEML